MSSRNLHVLIVDDDESWRMLHSLTLSQEGFTVEMAGGRDEALEKIEKGKFNMAIVDLRLVDTDPNNFDGIDVIKKLADKMPLVKVIVKSGYLTKEIEAQLKTLRIRGIVGKNGTLEEFLEVVRTVAND